MVDEEKLMATSERAGFDLVRRLGADVEQGAKALFLAGLPQERTVSQRASDKLMLDSISSAWAGNSSDAKGAVSEPEMENVVIVGSASPGAASLEFGSETRSPRPFLIPSLNAAVMQIGKLAND